VITHSSANQSDFGRAESSMLVELLKDRIGFCEPGWINGTHRTELAVPWAATVYFYQPAIPKMTFRMHGTGCRWIIGVVFIFGGYHLPVRQVRYPDEGLFPTLLDKFGSKLVHI
jgi:hypothetical protein